MHVVIIYGLIGDIYSHLLAELNWIILVIYGQLKHIFLNFFKKLLRKERKESEIQVRKSYRNGKEAGKCKIQMQAVQKSNNTG